jgi:predicted hydrocarbon binding protein
MDHGLNMQGSITNMAGFVTYLTKIDSGIDLNSVSQKLDLCNPVKGKKICGMYENFHITFFEDGEIWVDILASDDQSRQLMDVASFLEEVLGEQGINIDFTNLLLNAKSIQGAVPPNMIMHSTPKLFRPNLKNSTHVNLLRLLIHWIMFNELGDRWKETLKEFGSTIGSLAYASMADSIRDEYDAIDALKKFMSSNGVGIINQITPTSGEIIRLMVDESATSSGLSNVGRRLCYLESGIIQGFFSKFYDREILCEEEKCWALGNDHCEFIIKLGG